MGAAVPIVGAVITSFVVSKAVSALGPKLGLSESTSNMLGMGAGMVAGGYVAGLGSTAATADTVTATSGVVGQDIPTGYGGASSVPGPHASVAPGGVAPSAAAAPPPSPMPAPTAAPQGGMAGSTGLRMGAGMGAPQAPAAAPLQAPSIVDSNIAGTPLAPKGSQFGSAQSAGATGQSAADPGLLRQGQMSVTEAIPNPQAKPMGTSKVASQVAEQTMGGTTTPAAKEPSWWERLFSPEKTMDLLMAGIQGYGEAGMAKEDREYQEKIARQNEKGWISAYGSQPVSLNQRYPSGYGGP